MSPYDSKSARRSDRWVSNGRLAVVPILLGRGQRIWDGQEGLEERFHIEATASPSGVVHYVFMRR